QDAVGVSQLLHDQGDAADLPGGDGSGGDTDRAGLRLDHGFVPAGGDERDGVGREVNNSHGVLSCCVVGVLGVVDQVVGLVDLCCELFGEGVVQFAAVGVVQQGGGVGEDLRAAGLRGGLGEDLDLAVGVDGEDGQVGELGFGELTDVRGSNEAPSDSSRIVPGAAPRGGGSGAVPLTS